MGEIRIYDLTGSSDLAFNALIGALKDRSVNVRRSAAEALGKYGDSRATTALKSALRDAIRDHNRSLQNAVTNALYTLGHDA